MKFNRLVGTGVAIVLACGVWAGMSAGTLSIGGASVTTNFISQNGRVYVPLADVAKALNMSIAQSGSGYSLSPAGGANQVNGLSGKVGQVLNCGYATLQVVNVSIGDHYDYQFSSGSIKADNDKEQIVAIHLRVKNASQTMMRIGYGGTDNSALVDGNEHSYQSMSGPGHKDLPDGNELLPGSAKDFALLYSVPTTEVPKQLVYGVFFYQVRTKDLKEFRIDLK